MDAEKVIVNAHGQNEKGETVVVFRTDESPKLIEKAALALSGTIESVVDFFSKRENVINPYNSHVKADIKTGKVVLEVDDSVTVKTAVVSGQVVEHPWISALKINIEHAWDPKELLKKVRLSRMLFETSDQHGKMASSLANIQGKINTEFATADDFKGNTEQRKLTAVTSDIPTSFEFFFQPYIGMDKQSIPVEAQLVVENATVKVQLVSPKLAEILDAEKERQINLAIETMSSLPIILS